MKFVLTLLVLVSVILALPGRTPLRAQDNLRRSGEESAVSASQSESALQALSDAEFVRLLAYATHPTGASPEARLLALLPQGRGCGFGLILEALRRREHADLQSAAAIRAAFAPQSRQVRRLTPSGLIEIYYDTVGIDAPAMLDAEGRRIEGSAHVFVDHLASILDSVSQRFSEIGYRRPSPPTGTTTIPIEISELGGVWYGYVNPGLPRPNAGTAMPTYECALHLDNDFREFATTGLQGARVTVAHEFHHLVQMSEYGMWGNDRWMYEMSSTFMETRLYPDIRDYHQYVDDFMRTPYVSFYQWANRGYELVLHPMYLTQRFGDGVFRDTWENMRTVEPVAALREAAAAAGADYAQLFCQWGESVYWTGYRAGRISPQYYDHAAEFPVVSFQADQQLFGDEAEFTATLLPLASMYFRVHRGIDTVVILVSNTDLAAASKREKSGKQFRLRVRSSGSDTGWHALDNGWAYRVESDHDFCARVLEGGGAIAGEHDLPFPNPFRPDGTSKVYLPLPRAISANRASIRIFGPSMDLIASLDNQEIGVDALTGVTVSWNGRTDHGTLAPSGVYFYRITWTGGAKTGKIAVIRR